METFEPFTYLLLIDLTIEAIFNKIMIILNILIMFLKNVSE